MYYLRIFPLLIFLIVLFLTCRFHIMIITCLFVYVFSLPFYFLFVLYYQNLVLLKVKQNFASFPFKFPDFVLMRNSENLKSI
jgi:hypothetical protein